MSRITVRLIIHGRVQGVGYRIWARSEARRLQLDGYVMNRPDGTVELVAAGPSDAVTRLMNACRSGPSAAQVTSVEQWDADDEVPNGFEARRTV